MSDAPDLHAWQRDLDDVAPEKRMEIEAMRKDGRLVIREAFDIARRRLQVYARRRRAVKAREMTPHGERTAV